MRNKTAKQDFEQYLKEARTWETDKVRELQRSRKTAWWIASGSGTLAFTSVIAIVMLTPLKTVEPYVIRVDNSTGAVNVVQALRDGKTNYEETINKYFLQWYIRYREGYSRELATEYYSNVGLFSNNTEQQKYYATFNPKNPQSPLNIYGEYAKVKIDIQSVSFINSNIGLVRYTKKIERGLDQPQISHWAATIAFKYSGAPMKERDRGINPLGFQVTEYRNDPDAAITNLPSPAGTNQVSAQAAPSTVIFPTNPPAPIVPAIQQQ